MRVDGPGDIKKASDVRKAKRNKPAEASAFASMLEGFSETVPSAVAAPLQLNTGILSVDSEQYDASERRQQAMRGDDMLKYLDEIRMGLLAGGVPKERLIELGRVLAVGKDDIKDPGLRELIEEIETRAAVELAKLDINL